MEKIATPIPFKRWIKPVIIINGFIVFGAFCFYLGTIRAGCDIHKIKEIHFVNPQLLRGNVDYPMLSFFKAEVATKLKEAQPPYTEDKLKELIHQADTKIGLNKYFKVINADTVSYKMIVDDSRASNIDAMYMITPNSTFYLKPLKIVEDLQPS